MEANEIIKVLNDNREGIIKALEDANREAYKDNRFKYTVAVFLDGSTETRWRFPNDTAVYMNDSAIIELGNFNYQCFSVMWDGYNDSRDLFRDLINECSEEELKAYQQFLEDYQQKKREEWEDDDDYAPDDWDSCKWFEENSPAWERVRDKAIEWFIDIREYDYDAVIDEEIEMLKGEII